MRTSASQGAGEAALKDADADPLPGTPVERVILALKRQPNLGDEALGYRRSPAPQVGYDGWAPLGVESPSEGRPQAPLAASRGSGSTAGIALALGVVGFVAFNAMILQFSPTFQRGDAPPPPWLRAAGAPTAIPPPTGLRLKTLDEPVAAPLLAEAAPRKRTSAAPPASTPPLAAVALTGSGIPDPDLSQTGKAGAAQAVPAPAKAPTLEEATASPAAAAASMTAPGPATATAPAAALSRPLPAHGIAVQVGAFPSPDQAQRQWRTIQAADPEGAAGKTLLVQPVDVGAQHLFRALITPFSATSEASAFCGKLKASTISCFVRRGG